MSSTLAPIAAAGDGHAPHRRDVRDDIDDVLGRIGGAADRDLLRRAGVPRSALDNEVRRGQLIRLFPRTYGRPWLADDPDTRNLAALRSVGMPAVLSHLTALWRWQLLETPPELIHVTVPAQRCPRPRAGVRLYRARRLPEWVRLRGLVTVHPATAIASSWPLLAGPQRRSPAITAVRSRLVVADDLRRAVARSPRRAGRRQLSCLVDLLDAGCESELEIWGFLGVFDVPGLDHAVRQRQFRIGAATYRADLAFEEERVAVELDGDRYHSTRAQRERDRVRDAAFATIDWLTLRFSHARLHRDVAGVRRDTLRTLQVRRQRRS